MAIFQSPELSQPSPPGCPVAHTSPAGADGPRFAIYTEEFAADPHRFYWDMREQFGSMAPVEIAPGIPATLVTGYRTALRILNDPEHFPADPRIWQKDVPSDCPVLPMLEWRPNALRTAGAEHRRYRTANSAAINGIDLHAMHAVVEQIAIPLINSFCGDGHADLLAQYAYPLGFEALNTMLGCDPDTGSKVASGMAALFSGVDADKGNELMSTALLEHTRRKRDEPGDDITSRLIAHETELSDEEMVHQLVTLYGAGIEPQMNLVTNTLLLMLTDDRFAANVLDGSLSTRDALDEVLYTDPPIANYCMTYPRQPILIDNVWLPAHQPVLISIMACNNDPEIHSGQFADNRSHLAWSTGPHTCPARHLAYLVAQDAIDQLLDALPDMELAVPADQLQWRPGPFNRSLAALPVKFPESPPLHI